jgi:hypothetical protein
MVLSHLVKQAKEDGKIQREILADTQGALLGYALVNFANLKAKPVFQRDNPRRLNTVQIAAIDRFIEADGLRNKIPAHAMVAVVDSSEVATETLSKDMQALDFQELQFKAGVDTAQVELDILSGQHRYHWLLTKSFAGKLNDRNKCQTTLNSKEISSAKHAKATEDLAQIEKSLEDCVWLVQFFDKGVFARCVACWVFY